MPSDKRFEITPRVEKGRRLNVLPPNPDSGSHSSIVQRGRFPQWLHRKMPEGKSISDTHGLIQDKRLHTVCEEAKCPNILECFSQKTATFLVMGKTCTRACGFCEIDFSKAPPALNPSEPMRVAESVRALGLKHAVITMVARDDLQDGGAGHLVRVMEEIRFLNPETTIELLTSDLEGNLEALEKILAHKPEIFNHNIETTRRLTPQVRHKATYDRSLVMLQKAKEMRPTQLTKSGLMLGLGETEAEVHETLKDLRDIGCDIVTIGQYLQASMKKLAVKEFIHPDRFKAYEEFGLSLGIPYIYAGPFVRSSYNANIVFEKAGKTIAINSH